MAASVSPPSPTGSSGDRLVRRLSPEDLSILALEHEAVAGHTCKVIVLDGRIDPDLLRASILSRLDRASELCMCLRDIDGAACWAFDRLADLDTHVVVRRTDVPLDLPAFRTTVAGIFEQRLDRSRPLWRIDVVPALAGGRSAIIWRIHHALADGATAMRIAQEVLWDADPVVGARPSRVGRPSRRARARRRCRGAPPSSERARRRPRGTAPLVALAVRWADRRPAVGRVRHGRARGSSPRGRRCRRRDAQRCSPDRRGRRAAALARGPSRSPRRGPGEGAREPARRVGRARRGGARARQPRLVLLPGSPAR
jgi:Wax ester synthase-like Acyl-CoA acyltransferase domain